MFSSQVDGEQDLVEESTAVKKNPPKLASHPTINGITASGAVNGTVHILGGFIKQEPVSGRLIVNGGTLLGTTGDMASRGEHQPFLSLGFPLANTIDTDNNEVFFSCDMCNAKLKNKRNFETHMKRHRGELPFKCDECPKTFQGRRDLDTHKRSRHDMAKRGRMDIDMALTPIKEETVPCPSPFVFSAVEPPKGVGISMNGLTEGLMSGRASVVNSNLFYFNFGFKYKIFC
jgi:uncharacterized C2H2 Zn-finger protein